MVQDISQLSPRRQRRRAARTNQILDAAMQIIVDEGLEALTIQRLAESLDYAVGAIYRYFEGKDALIAELQRQVIRWLHERIQETVAKCAATTEKEGTPPEVAALVPIIVAARMYESLGVDAPAQFRLLSLSLSPQVLVRDEEALNVFEVAAPVLADVTAVFANAAATGALTPGNDLHRAVLFWASLQGILQIRKLARFGKVFPQPERLTGTLLETLLVGWGASEEHIAAAREFAGRIK